MHNSQRLVVTTGAIFLLANSAFADLSINPVEPITRQLRVQPIVLADSNGSNRAAFFGSDPHQTSIENMIDRIWAQAGIDIEWLEPNSWNNSDYVDFNDSQASDLLDDAGAAGVINPGTNLINAFFMRSVNGSPPAGNSANGTAFLGFSGTFQALGNLTASHPAFYEAAAHLVAHEIGHNLGLEHENDTTNLMLEDDDGNAGEQLEPSQIGTVLGSGFLSPYQPPAAADFNGDGFINGADLRVWEAGFGIPYANGDTNFDGDADGADFLVVQRGLHASTLTTETFVAVPEPSSWLLLIVMACFRYRRPLSSAAVYRE